MNKKRNFISQKLSAAIGKDREIMLENKSRAVNIPICRTLDNVEDGSVIFKYLFPMDIIISKGILSINGLKGVGELIPRIKVGIISNGVESNIIYSVKEGLNVLEVGNRKLFMGDMIDVTLLDATAINIVVSLAIKTEE